MDPIRFPRHMVASQLEDGWVIDPAFLRKVKAAHDAVFPHGYITDMEQIEEILLALEQHSSKDC